MYLADCGSDPDTFTEGTVKGQLLGLYSAGPSMQ